MNFARNFYQGLQGVDLYCASIAYQWICKCFFTALPMLEIPKKGKSVGVRVGSDETLDAISSLCVDQILINVKKQDMSCVIFTSLCSIYGLVVRGHLIFLLSFQAFLKALISLDVSESFVTHRYLLAYLEAVVSDAI